MFGGGEGRPTHFNTSSKLKSNAGSAARFASRTVPAQQLPNPGAPTTLQREAAMSLRIYFCGSIRGGRGDAGIYSRIIGHLKRFGQVLTEHVGRPELSDKGPGAEFANARGPRLRGRGRAGGRLPHSLTPSRGREGTLRTRGGGVGAGGRWRLLPGPIWRRGIESTRPQVGGGWRIGHSSAEEKRWQKSAGRTAVSGAAGIGN